MSENDWTRQNWIRFIGYSCAKVSGPSGVPRLVGKLLFSPLRIQAGMLDNAVLERASDT